MQEKIEWEIYTGLSALENIWNQENGAGSLGKFKRKIVLRWMLCIREQ